MHSATIIIPTLNEEQNIDLLLSELCNIQLDDCKLDILFVDDQSTDKTVDKIYQWKTKFSNISVLQRTGTPDLSLSIIEGVSTVSTDYIVVMDADLSHPINKIPNLLAPIINNTHDVVVGSRYVKGGGISNWPLRRRFLSWFGGLPARVLTDVKDTTSGFFACKKECFNNIDSNARGYKILLEMLAAGLGEFRVTESPITFSDRTYGQSKLSGKQLIQYFQRLIEISGGKLTSSVTGKFITVGLMGVIVDSIFFQIFINNGWSISSSHITSFFIAACFNYFFNSTWSFKFTHHTYKSWAVRAVKYIYFGIIALTIRGGVLAILISSFNVNPSLAIYPAILLASLVNYFGASFVVFPSQDKNNNSYSHINWRVIAIAITGFMILLRFLYLGSAELIPDEAYYWNYKQHLDIGYLDHPPMVSWAILLGTTLFGDTEFGVRFFALICGLLTLLFIYKLTLLFFDRTSAYISLLITSTLPFTVATGFLATTDALQVTLWAAILYFFAALIIKQKEKYWLAVGICMGIGLLSKYSILLIALGIFFYIIIDKASRRWWKSPYLYLSVILALAIFSPTIIWNSQNEWSSFLFQTTRRLDRDSSFSTHYILLHVLILLAPAALILLLNSYKNIKFLALQATDGNILTSTYIRFFIILITIPLFVYIYFSISHYPRFHWTSPIWLISIPLMAYSISPVSKLIHKHQYSVMMLFTSAALCLFYGAALHLAVLGLPINTESKYKDHYYWDKVAEHILEIEQQIYTETGEIPLVVGLSKWSIASSLIFYDKDNDTSNIISRNAIGKPAVMYEQWTNPQQWKNHPVIFVALNPNDLNSEKLSLHSSKLRPIVSKDILLNNNKLRNLNYRIAEGYKP